MIATGEIVARMHEGKKKIASARTSTRPMSESGRGIVVPAGRLESGTIASAAIAARRTRIGRSRVGA